MRTLIVVGVLILIGTARADEVVLTNGKTIPFRILKDAGDQIEVQTVDNQTISIPKKDVKDIKLSIPKTPLTGATFSGDTSSPADKPVNLLAAIDPKKHGVSGEWKFAAGALNVVGTGFLETPYVPPSSIYDVEFVVERKGGDSEFNIGLVAEGKPFSITLDWGRGECSGISVVNGTRIYENETRINGKQLTAKKPRQIIVAVRVDRIVVLLDGKEFINWVGSPKALSAVGRTKEQNLYLASHESAYSITKYVVTPRK